MLTDRELASIRGTLDAALPDGSTVNAAILAFHQPGGRDEYGDTTGTLGTQVWTGEVGCTLRRGNTLDDPDRTSTVSAQGATVVEIDELVVLRRELPEAVQVVPGDAGVGWSVVFEDRRGPSPVERQARVAGVLSWGEASLADKVRLQLDTETVA